MKENVISWVEIPVLEMARARRFYENVFGFEIEVQQFNDLLMGWFPFADGKPGASGSLVQHETGYTPSDSKGPVIYFACEDLQQELDRVAGAGGQILQPKTQISEAIGFMGVFLDSEGNRIALHSRK
ncbi:VOC family protein [Robiginitalea aurantiaca]|uniref:VOC family protein n=1 Tax=Robiginitalea aurantiaca TaxID=3056915 RepID=A0ABT7WCK3_9FLAO|nr:VOC family protein [Robiginitalea aurantiaca]MDM9630549.1 VOC family protein [Robiginitalea aurantiaca]